MIDDNDAVGLGLSTNRLVIAEGGRGDFTVQLNQEPSGTVTVTLPQPANTDVTLDTDSQTGGNQNTLTFTALDWFNPQGGPGLCRRG